MSAPLIPNKSCYSQLQDNHSEIRNNNESTVSVGDTNANQIVTKVRTTEGIIKKQGLTGESGNIQSGGSEKVTHLDTDQNKLAFRDSRTCNTSVQESKLPSTTSREMGKDCRTNEAKDISRHIRISRGQSLSNLKSSTNDANLEIISKGGIDFTQNFSKGKMSRTVEVERIKRLSLGRPSKFSPQSETFAKECVGRVSCKRLLSASLDSIDRSHHLIGNTEKSQKTSTDHFLGMVLHPLDNTSEENIVFYSKPSTSGNKKISKPENVPNVNIESTSHTSQTTHHSAVKPNEIASKSEAQLGQGDKSKKLELKTAPCLQSKNTCQQKIERIMLVEFLGCRKDESSTVQEQKGPGSDTSKFQASHFQDICDKVDDPLSIQVVTPPDDKLQSDNFTNHGERGESNDSDSGAASQVSEEDKEVETIFPLVCDGNSSSKVTPRKNENVREADAGCTETVGEQVSLIHNINLPDSKPLKVDENKLMLVKGNAEDAAIPASDLSDQHRACSAETVSNQQPDNHDSDVETSSFSVPSKKTAPAQKHPPDEAAESYKVSAKADAFLCVPTPVRPVAMLNVNSQPTLSNSNLKDLYALHVDKLSPSSVLPPVDSTQLLNISPKVPIKTVCSSAIPKPILVHSKGSLTDKADVDSDCSEKLGESIEVKPAIPKPKPVRPKIITYIRRNPRSLEQLDPSFAPAGLPYSTTACPVPVSTEQKASSGGEVKAPSILHDKFKPDLQKPRLFSSGLVVSGIRPPGLHFGPMGEKFLQEVGERPAKDEFCPPPYTHYEVPPSFYRSAMILKPQLGLGAVSRLPSAKSRILIASQRSSGACLHQQGEITSAPSLYHPDASVDLKKVPCPNAAKSNLPKPCQSGLRPPGYSRLPAAKLAAFGFVRSSSVSSVSSNQSNDSAQSDQSRTTNQGRRGLGSVFVWASGNGGRSRDHCSCDGYTNSIYTISISSTAESGKKPWYLEECASTLATTYSSGESYDRKIITTDLRQRCTDSHTGTSASAPMAAGIIALALEANPFLTWRDIQHIIVRTSRAGHLNANDWKTNAAGYKVSHLYGFGLMDAEAMVIEAEKWTTVPPQHVCVENTDRQIKTIRPDSVVRSIYKATGCSDNPNHHVIYLEHVVVRITITHPRRGDLAIYLTSPSGTRSQLLANRLFDHSMEGFKNWEFMTTHCWSEKAAGDWILEICDTPSQLRNFKTPGKLKEWSLVLYGTSIQPYSPRNDFPKVERVRSSPVEDPTEDYGTDDYSGPCNAECSKVGCDGPGPDHCTDCLHYYYKSKNNTRICVSTCPPGHYNADKKRCKKCSPNCETCVGGHSDQCMTCKSGYYLNEVTNSCITNCPDGFYLDKNKIVCRKCSENCKTCVEFQICTECKHGLSLHGTKCAIRCEDGKYHNGRECEPCHRSCATCAGGGVDACINCTQGYLMEDGRCVQSCSTGYYLDQSTESGYKSCKRCDASCLDCSGHGDRNCTICPSGYNLDSGVCVVGTVCKDDEYLDDSQECQLCEVSCQKCTGPEPDDCISCPSTRFFDDGRCVMQCPRGKFEFRKQCHLCHHTCQDCSGSEPNKCTACGTDRRGMERFLYHGVCKESCPPGHYHSEHTCVPCSAHCEVCLDSRHCKRCFRGYYLTQNICQKRSCREGEVEDPDSEDCVPCSEGCLNCQLDDPRICITCIQNYYMYKQHCYKYCPENTYSDESSLQCRDCPSNCDSCDKDKCDLCKEGFYLSGDTCVSECGDGFFTDDISRECEPCHRTCTTCVGYSYENCTGCQNDFLLSRGRCLNPRNNPPDGKFWSAAEKQLQSCHPSCWTCDKSADSCTSCPEGKFLIHNTCVSQCPQQTFADAESGKCEMCMDNCEVCSDLWHCQKCQAEQGQSFFLHKGRCLQECPEGYFNDSGTCKECSGSCETCMGSATKCQSCKSPLLLEQGECKPTCSKKHFAFDGICKHCPEMCLECIHSETCKECVDEFFLHEGKCVEDCPSHFYAEDKHCFPCHGDCKDCEGPDSDDCTECAVSFFVLYDGMCFEKCPEGTYYEEETEDCQACNRTCQTCSSSTACLTCRNGLTLSHNGHCVLSGHCSRTEYYDEKARTCRHCHKKCFHCSGPTEHQCISCADNHYLLNTTCVEACPAGYYADSGEGRCSPCHSACATCSGKHSSQCLSCKPGLYRQGKGCVNQCPMGYFAQNSTGSCERCHKGCKECMGPQPTDCLFCDSFFYLLRSRNKCVSSCPEYYYENKDDNVCERCHPSCRTCEGKEGFSCTSCVWSYSLISGMCNSDCFVGYYKVQEAPGQEEDEPKCERCDGTCTECKGPGPLNCTVCPAGMQLYLEESRCLPCCRDTEPTGIPACCDCSETQDDCVLRTTLPPASKNKSTFFVITCILLLLVIGAIVVIWRKSKSKPRAVSKARYEKLTNDSKIFPSYMSNYHESTSYQEDQVIEYRDRDIEDDDDEDDIVYMSQDGTVYRKFKYGLLEDDEEDELEYDDESYSFR